MGLLDQEVLDGLTIQRMIFHVVGPSDSDLQLMDEIDITGFEDFFLERVRETNLGNRFQFIGTQSGVRPALQNIHEDASKFLQLTKEMAETFQNGHLGTPSSSRGAFIVAQLSGMSSPAFALIKFDDQKVLRYQETVKEGRVRAKVSEVDKTFSEDRKAMQKSALIILNEEGGDLAIYDRTNKRNITDYFKTFLGVKRLWQPADATDLLKQALEAAINAHQATAPEEVRRNWRRRLHDATRTRETIEPGNDLEVFGAEVFGAFWENENFRREVDRKLHLKRISGEVIEIAKERIRPPPMRRLKTRENVLIIYPTQLDDAATVVKVDRQPDGNAVITIRTQGIVDDEFTDESATRRTS